MEAIGQLAGGIAHDFNNLLGVIIGNLDLLERSVTGQEAVIKRIKTLQRTALRGSALTKHLLSFARVQKFKSEPIFLENAIKNLMEMAGRTVGPEYKLITKLDPSIPAIFVNASEFENALLNLIVNARDAMPKGGDITIASEFKKLDLDDFLVKLNELKPGNYARITISDTGCGMSKETVEKAFNPFFTTKERGKGTGLGLSMVYSFAKKSDGLARIYSEIDQGTTVSLYLPIAEGAHLKPQPIIEKPIAGQLGGTVLVVDDEADILEIAVSYLTEMGFRVLQATDGASAVAIAEREPEINLLITDIVMPGGMNGLELSEKIKQVKPAIKILYSSGYTSDALSEKRGIKIDAPLLDKPYQRSEFIAMVQKVMGSSQ